MVDYLLRVLNVVLVMLKRVESVPQVALVLHVPFQQVLPYRLQLQVALLQTMQQVTVFRQVEIP